ncbi:hypothetical protein JX580_03555 [Thiomicrospira microaerophila]|uniref:hypothetical protein n=1 Tax=Thiomicrospira microaerophila TaxID=406020 RepID=UPI00200E9B18|nr:hypothetical protein [Thiomicrospira microaerophila]UQB42979.1 hypothetical protein JX580_03555 [Thiomicrospira microaerophila]
MVKIGQALATAPSVLNTVINSPQLLLSLKSMVGQTVSLQVLQREDGGLKVSVAGQSFLAKTQLEVTPGQTLLARVTEHQGQIRLIVNQEGLPKLDDKAIYRQLLPNSTAVNQVLSTLMQPQMLAQLPASVQATVNQILNQLLRIDSRLTAEKFKQALEGSGVIFESSLRKKHSEVNKDLKGQLFKLQQQIADQAAGSRSTPSLAQALGLVGQAINQISLLQYNQLGLNDLFTSTIPMLSESRVEAIQIEIRHKPDREHEVWEVMFSLQIHDAPLVCLLSYGEDLFECKFYIEDQDVMARIKQHQDLLEHYFAESGLKLRSIQWLACAPNFSAQAKRVGLIDVKV